MRSAILLVLAVAVGACGHPTYGRPTPRDTVPTTKAPGTTEPKPNEKPITKELNRNAGQGRQSTHVGGDHHRLRVHGDRFYFNLGDQQSDLWMAEIAGFR